MDQEFQLYRPYKTEKNTIYSGVFSEIIGACLVLLSYPNPVMYFFLFSLTIILWCTFGEYRNYSIVIAFGQNEIQVLGDKFFKKYSWADFSDAYYSFNSKGYLYVVLSNGPLSEEQVKYAHKKAFFSTKNICLESILLIGIGGRKKDKDNNLPMIKEQLHEHQVKLHE